MKRTRHCPARAVRPAFTLLEVLLSTVIGVMLLAALYVALEVQLRHVQTGREMVEHSLLVRALLTRIGNDITTHLAPTIPVSNNSSSSNSTTANGTQGTSSTSGTAGSSTGSTTSSSMSSNSSSTTSSSPSSSSSPAAVNSLTGPVVFNLGVQGDTTLLVLYISRVPRELNYIPAGADAPPLVSDLRRVCYWIVGGSGDQAQGLARQEVKVETSDDALVNFPPNIADEASNIIAEEVKSLEVHYFDGVNWQDSWDGTTLGSDGVTPIGPPLAISVTLGVPGPGAKKNTQNSGDQQLKYYRHVISIPSANGIVPPPQPMQQGTGQ